MPDTNVADAYRVILPLKNQPAALVLTRQNLPTLDRAKYAAASGLQCGGYILADAPDGRPEVILIGTGSEVSLCVAAYEKLLTEGVKARVVSMPCWELFDAQPAEYRDAVLPPDVRARVAVEAAHPVCWHKYVGLDGALVCMNSFGASAPCKVKSQVRVASTLIPMTRATSALSPMNMMAWPNLCRLRMNQRTTVAPSAQSAWTGKTPNRRPTKRA